MCEKVAALTCPYVTSKIFHRTLHGCDRGGDFGPRTIEHGGEWKAVRFGIDLADVHHTVVHRLKGGGGHEGKNINFRVKLNEDRKKTKKREDEKKKRLRNHFLAVCDVVPGGIEYGRCCWRA